MAINNIMDIKEKDKKTEEMCGLVDFHKDCLDILLYIDKIAKENNIQYSTCGGTMLGQIRHKGFIPWDDDVDIVMTREYFTKFIDILNSKLDKTKFKLLTPKSYNGDFVDLVFRVVNLENSYKNSNNFGIYEDLTHPWVDIFVLDKAPENKLRFKIHSFKLKFIYALLCSKKKIKISIKINFIYRLGMFCLKLLGKLFTLNYLLKLADKEANKYNNKNIKSIGLHYTNSMVDVDTIVKYDYLKDYTYLKYESIELMCFKNYDEILKETFGDYMTPRIDSKKFIRHFDLSKYSDEEIANFYKNN